MNLLHSITEGFHAGFKYSKAALYIFLIQFFLSCLTGILVYFFVWDAIGHTCNLLIIEKGYDHDVFQDLILYKNTAWVMVRNFMYVVIVVYLFIGPFISGGLLSVFKDESDHWHTFWHGGSVYYYSMLKLNAAFTGLTLIVLGLIGYLGYRISTYGLENWVSEIPVLVIMFSFVLLFIFCLILILSASANAKWEVINGNSRSRNALKTGIRICFKRPLRFLLIGLIFLAISFMFILSVNLIIDSISESGFTLVLIAFLVQLCATFLRVILRNAYIFSLIH